jgi:hypothetical protein
MSVFSTVWSRLAAPSSWRYSWTWLAWAVMTAAFPLIGAAVTLATFSEGNRIPELFSEGQLSLYACAATGTAIYLCSIDHQSTKLRGRTVLSFFAYSILIVSVIIFASVQAADVIADKTDQSIDINNNFVVFVTVPSLVGSYIVAFFTVLYDKERMSISPVDIADEQQADLADKFRKLDL